MGRLKVGFGLAAAVLFLDAADRRLSWTPGGPLWSPALVGVHRGLLVVSVLTAIAAAFVLLTARARSGDQQGLPWWQLRWLVAAYCAFLVLSRVGAALLLAHRTALR